MSGHLGVKTLGDPATPPVSDTGKTLLKQNSNSEQLAAPFFQAQTAREQTQGEEHLPKVSVVWRMKKYPSSASTPTKSMN